MRALRALFNACGRKFQIKIVGDGTLDSCVSSAS